MNGPDGATYAFLYTNANVVDLGTLGHTFSVAEGLNDSGEVTGVAGATPPSAIGFLYHDGQMIDLNTLIDPSLGISISDAPGINDLGQIAATARDSAGYDRAVLLTPIPEPRSMAVLGLVLIGLASTQ